MGFQEFDSALTTILAGCRPLPAVDVEALKAKQKQFRAIDALFRRRGWAAFARRARRTAPPVVVHRRGAVRAPRGRRVTAARSASRGDPDEPPPPAEAALRVAELLLAGAVS